MQDQGKSVGVALYWRAVRGSISHVSENNLALVSAGVAFFAMLSLFPALAALIAVLGLISDPAVVIVQLEELRDLLPNDVYEIINAQVVALVTARSETLGWAGLLSVFFALWSARAGVGAMIIGLNSVCGERNRNVAHHYVRALLITLVLVAVGIVALLSLVVAPVVLAFRSARPRVRWLSAGAVLAVVSWVILSVGFSYYVTNFGNYNQVYGSIGAVIAMLVWLWISSFLVLFGAALNVQIEAVRQPMQRADRRKGEAAPPT